MLTERVEVRIEVLPNGLLQLREEIVVERDGVFITRLYNRRIAEPDTTHTETEPRIVKVIEAVWTPEVIAAYKKDKEQTAEPPVKETRK